MGIEWDRVAPTAWQDALDAVYPPSEHLSSFYCRWEPGDPWQPIERWMIWQLRPIRFTRPDVLAALRGPHPRATGHYCAPGWCACALKANKWRGGTTALIDRGTWEVYRETGRYGVRWWTIQGHQGGHRHRLTPAESQIAKFFAGTPDTPRPGDLPYAAFDQRTYWKIAETDRVHKWRSLVDFHERSHDRMDAEDLATATKAGELMWGWLESQVEKAAEKVGRAGLLALRDAAPRRPWESAPALDEDRVRHDVIHEMAHAV